MVEIQDCMLQCGMRDMISTGCLFTWNNKQKEDTRVFCKLDRVMVNDAWEEAFPSANAHFMPEGYFDHCPMVIQVYPQLQKGKSPFKYYTMWSSARNFQEIVKTCWDTRVEGSLMFRVVSKLKMVKQALKQLNAEGFNELQATEIKAMHHLVKCQDELKEDIGNSDKRDAELKASEEYRRVHNIYMSFLRQKAKLSWCKEGDENSHLFHQSIKARRVKNTVYAIHDSRGVWQDEPQKVNDAFLCYYKELLGQSMIGRVAVKKGVVERGPVLSEEQIQELSRNYDADEVKQAMESIPGEKAPGPDGLVVFLQDTGK
ncbi:uncharacterized protein LOC130591853 [Beta vulgaris subsp. vulgaris]|uniref:uncharacterized protein LOC130591853 n=1 Tax=Beta vulgaris subsp. vulgaris TaxID=3555 RepID=UPI002548AC3E|nr:uncharacterized protein LOC130591853 [Beta vulgaris subsp. vulgaris]